ncbi:MAG: polysaccharide deacetylase family protein, partial [Alphaproteobacteria bacterium]
MRSFYFVWAVLLSLAFCQSAMAAISLPEDRHSAVILAYQRIGEEAYPDNNLLEEQFLDHVKEFTNGGYTILPLAAIIDAAKNHRELPPRTLAITFEGAYKSALGKAIPELLKNNIPFTIFYSSGQIDGNSEQMMGWSELKSLSNNAGVSLGILPAAYARLADKPGDEIKRQINKARMRHREVFGNEPEFFSYPFGEYSLAYKNIVAHSGFKAAFGLHAGSVYDGSDFLALPRFSMSERFGNIDRFRMIAASLPLPAIDIEPQDPHLGTDTPSIGFSVPLSLKTELKNLSCFVSGQPQPDIQTLGNRVEVRLTATPNGERLRVNCTMPGPMDTEHDTEQWRWLGMILTSPAYTPDQHPDQREDIT